MDWFLENRRTCASQISYMEQDDCHGGIRIACWRFRRWAAC